jgi:hypothetical protein
MQKIKEVKGSLVTEIEGYLKRRDDSVDLVEKANAAEERKGMLTESLSKSIIDITRVRNERNLMQFPICSISKRKRLEAIRYTTADGSKYLEVTANHEYGMVKIWDMDILRYALSKAGEVYQITKIFPNSVEFSGYEVLKATGRSTSTGKNYKWLREALERLCSTVYKGNVFPSPEGEKLSSIFTLVSASWEDRTGKLEKIVVCFNKRLIESVKYNNGLLAVNYDILKEESGIKKRLLELIQVSMGNSSVWEVALERLAQLCAHQGAIKDLKRYLKKYDLPWSLSFRKSKNKKEIVTFSKK